MDSKYNYFALKAFVCLLFSCSTFAGTISLSTDISLPAPIPDPNEEITIWVNSDSPLFYMNLIIHVNGDATITEAMTAADCNDFGWEPNSLPASTINPDSVELSGLNWSNNDHETVGYFKFRCNSGQVAVYIDTDSSFAFSWSEGFTCSDEPITVGTPELPPLIQQEEPEPVLLDSPTNASGPPRGEMDGFTEWPQQFEMMNGLDSEPIVTVIDSDITENQVWDANDIYYIVGDPNDSYIVDVNSLLVIEPGTTVIMGYQAGLHVNNGGTLIAKGKPNNPVVFTPDWIFFDYPDYVGYYWQVYNTYGPSYHCPIYIEKTASPITTVQYCMIEGAVVGVITENIRLNQPIENNYLFGNAWGVYEFGPMLTDVRNNLCFYQDQAAIEIQLCPDPNGFADLEHVAQIEQNTCDGSGYTYCGITVHGVADPNTSGIPTINLINNIVTGNYHYGLNLVDGAMYATVISTGYYGNYFHKNWEFDEYNPVVTETSPYYPYTLDYPWQHHYLANDADFVDAGVIPIEFTNFFGMTTDENGTPDRDIVDIGFHHMDWNYTGVEGVVGTDIDDVITLSDYWLCYSPYDPNSPTYDPNIFDPNSPSYISDPNLITFDGDWNGDEYVDLTDFALMSQIWQAAPDEPNISPILSFNPDTGWLNISVTGYNPDTVIISAYVNGKYVGKVYQYGNEIPLSVDVSTSGNKPQQIKFAAMNADGYISWSGPAEFCYTSPLSYCILPSAYEPNEPVPFTAYNTEYDTVSSISVYANGGQLVWSQSFTGNTVAGSIPDSVITNHCMYVVNFESASGSFVSKIIVKDPKPFMAPNPKVKGLIVVPSLHILLNETRTVNAVEQAFRDRGIKYVALVGPFASWRNIAKYASQLEYLYIDAHGQWSITTNENTPGVLRTNVRLADGPCVSAKASDFIGTPPLWCRDPLPGYLETGFAKSFASMGFKKLRFFYNDSCFGGHLSIGSHGNLVEGRSGQQGLLDPTTHSDMSIACGMTSTTEDRFYAGWFDESESLWWPKPETPYQKFSRLVWESMGQGNDLYEATTDAITYVIMTGGEDDAIDDFRIKGQTYLWNVRLSSN